jgi:hypothetical protein
MNIDVITQAMTNARIDFNCCGIPLALRDQHCPQDNRCTEAQMASRTVPLASTGSRPAPSASM